MSENQQDPESKTEEPSERKREETLNQGQNAVAQELVGAISLMGAFAGIILLVNHTGTRMTVFSTWCWENALTWTNSARDLNIELTERIGTTLLWLVGPIVAGAIIGGIAASLAQGAGKIRWKILELKPERFNPFTGVLKLFGKKAFVDAGMGFLKLSVVWCATGLAAWLTIKKLVFGLEDPVHAIGVIAAGLSSITVRGIIVLLALGLLEHLRRKHQLHSQMKMTKFEATKERKEQDGDPLLKQRQRQFGLNLVKNKSIPEALKSATVVITNPTHYAVALQYIPEEMPAPKVVAKGAGALAAIIRQHARKNSVPLIENPPLARGIFRSAAVGEEIPPMLYEAVAHVLAHIFKIGQSRQNWANPSDTSNS